MANTSILTDTAKSSAQQTVYDFGAGAYAHANGDYGQHTQIRVTTTPYVDTASDVAQDAVTGQTSVQLRMLSTEGNTDIAVVVPVTLSGTLSALEGQPPLIIRNPADSQKIVGQVFHVDVYAISDITLAYQWQKAELGSTSFSVLNEQTTTAVSITNVQFSHAGIYRVVVANANGTTLSTNGTLLVYAAGAAPSGVEDDDGGIPSFFQPFHGIFGDFF